MNIDELSSWLHNNCNNIPQPKKRERTLMDITGVTHHENMWSDIYKFFFLVNEEHHLIDLFIGSLEYLLRVNGKFHEETFLHEFSVDREYPTNRKERIDLLLSDYKSQRAIIIENKVNHFLDNDLNHYYEYVKEQGFKEVKLVVLGLRKYNLEQYPKADKISFDDIISITHEDLLSEVSKRLPNYYAHATPQHLYLLQEFTKNIINETHAMDSESLKFFYDGNNHEMINQLSNLRTNIINSIQETMDDADTINSLLQDNGMELEYGKHSKSYCYFYNHYKGLEGEAMITIVYHPLWDYSQHGCRVKAILEFQDELLKWVEAHLTEIEQNTNCIADNNLLKDKSCWHYQLQEICFDNPYEALSGDYLQTIFKHVKEGVYKTGLSIVEYYNRNGKKS